MHDDLLRRISKLDKELNFLIETNPSSPMFAEKEREIRQLRRQVEEIERDKILQPPVPPPSYPFDYALPPPMFTPSPSPIKMFPSIADLIPREPPKPRRRTSSTSLPSTSSSQTSFVPPPKSKDKGPAFPQFMATPASGSSSDVDDTFLATSSSSSFSLPQVLMNEQPPMEPKVEHPDDPFDDAPFDLPQDQPAPPRPTAGPWFTFDDIPPGKWRSRILEFNAWLDTQMTAPYANLKKVLAEFTSRFTGSLREWFFNGLSEYEQKKFLAERSISAVLVTIHNQFLGNYQLIYQQRKQEFFDRKCCSLKFRDLEKHYQRMNHLYHEIGGYKDENLKLTFIASLPQLIQPEVQRLCGPNIAALKLGEIWQNTLTAVDRMCEQQRLFKKIAKEEDSASPATLFALPYSDSDSDSDTDSDDMTPVLTIGPPITLKQEPPDIVCPESPDFISCPLSPLPLSPNPFDDLSFAEISYCFPDIPAPCKIPTPVSSPSLSDSSSLILFPLSSPEPEESLPSSPDISSVQFSHPVPLISMHVLPDNYEKPVTVTALFDIGSHCTMINPDVLPAHVWKKKILHFSAADGKKFQTTMITKKKN
ncbi:hypothetical protein JCGZ_03824 [Jatropha curcas]|uniref:Uncharacterized protein n=1 Tax=Jatropha curcas TaxID=180498 RepID=A0A067JA66_JATCU|nr:hypothetical protein JCGZ_03824 [Jatropha curcas]